MLRRRCLMLVGIAGHRRPSRAFIATGCRQSRPALPSEPADDRRDRRDASRVPEHRVRSAVRALVIVLWRSGLRISEALALEERDLDPAAGSITVRRGKGGKRRIVGMDPWAWQQIEPWLHERLRLPPGPVFCVVHGPTAGRHLSASAARTALKRLAADAGVRRRIAPHQLRHCHAIELVREGVPVHLLQRQLGHANLAVTTVYLVRRRARRSSARRSATTPAIGPDHPLHRRELDLALPLVPLSDTGTGTFPAWDVPQGSGRSRPESTSTSCSTTASSSKVPMTTASGRSKRSMWAAASEFRSQIAERLRGSKSI